MEEQDDTTVAGSDERSPGSGRRRPYLIVMSGRRFGEAIQVTRDNILVGKGPDADLRLEEEGVSRDHAKIVLFPKNVCIVKDLGSTNGTYVNGDEIQAHPLEHGDQIRVGTSTLLRFSIEDAIESQLREHLFSQATSDPLTGIKNKKAFDDELIRNLAYSRRHGEELSIVLFDADHFKRVNDEHGHSVGDEVLKELTERVTKTIRVEDHFSRVGGEEFALVLRGIDTVGAGQAAERIRVAVSQTPFSVADKMLDVTISLGCATFDKARHARSEDLLQEADRELYRAKGTGRNCVSPTVTPSMSPGSVSTG